MRVHQGIHEGTRRYKKVQEGTRRNKKEQEGTIKRTHAGTGPLHDDKEGRNDKEGRSIKRARARCMTINSLARARCMTRSYFNEFNSAAAS